MTDPDDLTRFWEQARTRAGLGRLSVITGTSAAMALPPPAWSFGHDPAGADAGLELVLQGVRTATSAGAWEYEAAGAEPPRAGDLTILLDGAGSPRALLRTTAVRVVAFDEVDAAHAAAEDGVPLAQWRDTHREQLAADLAGTGRRFSGDLPVLLEAFRLLHPRPRRRAAREPAPVPG